MEHRAFTEGIEMGGITTDYEARMLVCWLIDKIGAPMSMQQLNYAFSRDGLVNYFELANAVGTLISSGHLCQAERANEQEQRFALTETGVKTAGAFEKDLPLSVRQKSLDAATEGMRQELLEKENKADIEKTPDGYRLRLEFCDVKSSLLELSMYVPTLEMAQKMKKCFLNDPTIIYREAIKILSSEEI